MPVSPAMAERKAKVVLGYYQDAEQNLVAKIAKAASSGLDKPQWAEQKLSQVQQLKREIREYLDNLKKKAAPGIKDAIQEAYEQGGLSALQDLDQSNKYTQAARVGTPVVDPMYGIQAIEDLSAAAVSNVTATHDGILRNTMDQYQTVVGEGIQADLQEELRSGTAEAGSQVLLGNKTRNQAVQQALNNFAQKGITGFIDKSGRGWSMESYTEMALRTSAGRAAVQGHLDRLSDEGIDLVIVSDAPRECPLCRPWEGKVLSIGSVPVEKPPDADPAFDYNKPAPVVEYPQYPQAPPSGPDWGDEDLGGAVAAWTDSKEAMQGIQGAGDGIIESGRLRNDSDSKRAGAILSGIADSPETTVPLYRGGRLESADFKIGTQVDMGLTSWSKDVETGLEFAEKGKGQKVVFSLPSGVKALDVSGRSEYDYETESIFAGITRVAGVRKEGRRTFVDLELVQDIRTKPLFALPDLTKESPLDLKDIFSAHRSVLSKYAGPREKAESQALIDAFESAHPGEYSTRMSIWTKARDEYYAEGRKIGTAGYKPKAKPISHPLLGGATEYPQAPPSSIWDNPKLSKAVDRWTTTDMTDYESEQFYKGVKEQSSNILSGKSPEGEAGQDAQVILDALASSQSYHKPLYRGMNVTNRADLDKLTEGSIHDLPLTSFSASKDVPVDFMEGFGTPVEVRIRPLRDGITSLEVPRSMTDVPGELEHITAGRFTIVARDEMPDGHVLIQMDQVRAPRVQYPQAPPGLSHLDVDEAIHAWSWSYGGAPELKEIKEATALIIKSQVAPDTQGGRRAIALMKALETSPVSKTTLYRGIHNIDVSTMRVLGKVGSTHDLPLSSFSELEDAANLYGRFGPTSEQVLYKLLPGSKALKIENTLGAEVADIQKERLVAGRFKVVKSYRDSTGRTIIEIRQEK